MNDARTQLLRIMVERMVKLLREYMPALPPPPPGVTSGRLEMLKLKLDDPDYIESRRRAVAVLQDAIDVAMRPSPELLPQIAKRPQCREIRYPIAPREQADE